MDLIVAHHPGWDVTFALVLPVLVYIGLRVWESRKGPPTPDEDDAAADGVAGSAESGRAGGGEPGTPGDGA